MGWRKQENVVPIHREAIRCVPSRLFKWHCAGIIATPVRGLRKAMFTWIEIVAAVLAYSRPCHSGPKLDRSTTNDPIPPARTKLPARSMIFPGCIEMRYVPLSPEPHEPP